MSRACPAANILLGDCFLLRQPYGERYRDIVDSMFKLGMFVSQLVNQWQHIVPLLEDDTTCSYYLQLHIIQSAHM